MFDILWQINKAAPDGDLATSGNHPVGSRPAEIGVEGTGYGSRFSPSNSNINSVGLTRSTYMELEIAFLQQHPLRNGHEVFIMPAM